MPEKIHARGGVSVHSSVDGHLCLLPHLAVVNPAAMNLCARISVHIDLGLSGKQPAEAELDHMVDPLLNF